MKTSLYYVLLFFFGMMSCTSTSEEKLKTESSREKKEVTVRAPVYHSSHEPKKANAPFSDVVQVGNVYYLSGQIGMDHTTRTLVDGGIAAETTQALENIKSVLAVHSLSMGDVIKATVILDDINDFSQFNAIYEGYFPQKPARTTFAAEALARGAKIEIEVVAVKSGN